MKDILLKLKNREDLTSLDIEKAFQTILNEETASTLIGAFLMGLSQKGETSHEIAAAAAYLRSHAHLIQSPPGAIDCCGTGGDLRGTYNISTAVALVVAACGVPVAKHGNRAASSKSGAADVLEELEVNLSASLEQQEQALKKCNFCFLMAPKHHHALKPIAPIRKELGFQTIFNLLGPLANPAGTRIQLIGVFDKKWLRPMAEALKELGSERAWVVHGRDGLDEITLTAETDIVQLDDSGNISEITLTPEDFGLSRSTHDELKGGDASYNAKALNEVLNSAPSAYRDIVLANAAAVLVLHGTASDLKEGVSIATDAIDTGKAQTTLKTYISLVS